MAPVKAVFDLIDQIGCVPVEVIERHVDLENLFAVAHLGGPLDCSGSTEPGTKPATGLLLQLCEEIAHFVRCNARSCTVMRPTHFIAQVTCQHAPCRQHRRGGRYDDALDFQFARDFDGVQTRRAAKTQERKPPRIDPAAQCHQPDAVRHVQVDHAVDAGGGFQPGKIERRRNAVDCGFRCSPVKRALASHESSRVEIAENDIGVADGRRETAIAIAGRPRHRTRALRTHSQCPAGIDSGDRPSPSCDTGDVETAQRNTLPG